PRRKTDRGAKRLAVPRLAVGEEQTLQPLPDQHLLDMASRTRRWHSACPPLRGGAEMFHIVQPCADGPRRFEHATVVSSHGTVDAAFDELERMRAILGTHGLTGCASDLAVVTDDRSLIHTRVQAIEATLDAPAESHHASHGHDRGHHNGEGN